MTYGETGWEEEEEEEDVGIEVADEDDEASLEEGRSTVFGESAHDPSKTMRERKSKIPTKRNVNSIV